LARMLEDSSRAPKAWAAEILPHSMETFRSPVERRNSALFTNLKPSWRPSPRAGYNHPICTSVYDLVPLQTTADLETDRLYWSKIGNLDSRGVLASHRKSRQRILSRRRRSIEFAPSGRSEYWPRARRVHRRSARLQARVAREFTKLVWPRATPAVSFRNAPGDPGPRIYVSYSHPGSDF